MASNIEFVAKIDSIRTAGVGDEGEYVMTIRVPHNDVQADVLGARLLSLKRHNTVYAFAVRPEYFQMDLFDATAPMLEEELVALEPDKDEPASQPEYTLTEEESAALTDLSNAVPAPDAGETTVEGLTPEEREQAERLGYLPSSNGSRRKPKNDEEATEQAEAEASLSARSK